MICLLEILHGQINYFTERTNKVKERLEIFSVDHYASVFETKIFLLRNKKYFYQSPTQYYTGRSKQTYLLFIGLCNTFIYLNITEACLRVTAVMFSFCHLKNFSYIMKNVFNSISIYS